MRAKTLAEIWPEAEHQLCVFHAISEINDLVLDAVREVKRAIKPKRIKKGKGRPGKRQRVRVKKLKEQRPIKRHDRRPTTQHSLKRVTTNFAKKGV